MTEKNENIDFSLFNEEDRQKLNALLVLYQEVYKNVVDLEVKFAMLKTTQEDLLAKGRRIYEEEQSLCKDIADREGVDVVTVSNASGAYAIKLLQSLQEQSEELNNQN